MLPLSCDRFATCPTIAVPRLFLLLLLAFHSASGRPFEDDFVHRPDSPWLPAKIQFDPLAGMPGVQYVERLGENCTGFSLEPDGDLFGDVLSCYIRCSELPQCRGYVMTLDGIRCTLKGYDCQLVNDAQSVFYEKSGAAAAKTETAPTAATSQAACGAVPVVENAFVTGSSKSYHENKPGDVVMFSCLPGFEMVGTGKLTCLGTGKWDNPAPICLSQPNATRAGLIEQGFPTGAHGFIEHPDHDCTGGDLTGWIRDRQTCEAACNEDITCNGFIVDIKNGSCVLKTADCQLISRVPVRATFIKTGSLLNAKKAVEGPQVATTSTTQEMPEVSLSSTAPPFDGPRCSPAPEIEGGIIYLASTWGPRRPGDWVSYNCIQGYVLNGNFLISCLPDGSWEYPPECVKNTTVATSTTSTTTTTTRPTTTTTTTTTAATTTTTRATTTMPERPWKMAVTMARVDNKHPRFVITNLQCSHADTLTTPFLERSACEEYCLRVAICDGYTVSVLRTSKGPVEGTDCVPRRRCSAGFAAASSPQRSHNFYKKITLQHIRQNLTLPFRTVAAISPGTTSSTTTTTTTTTPKTTTTTVIGCPDVPKITNGFVYLASNFETRRPGDWVTYECDQGFRMTGKFIVKCLDNGTWETLPSCTKDGKAPPPQILPNVGGDGNDLGSFEQVFAEEVPYPEPLVPSKKGSNFKVSTICMTELARFRKSEEDITNREAVFVVPCVLAINLPLAEIGMLAKRQLRLQRLNRRDDHQQTYRTKPRRTTTSTPPLYTLVEEAFEHTTEATIDEMHKAAIKRTRYEFLDSRIQRFPVTAMTTAVTPTTQSTTTTATTRTGTRTRTTAQATTNMAEKVEPEARRTTADRESSPRLAMTTPEGLPSDLNKIHFDRIIEAAKRTAMKNKDEKQIIFDGGEPEANVLDSFEDIGHNCRGDGLPEGEFTDMDECARRCLDMGSHCYGFTALNERGIGELQKPFKCILKGKRCEMLRIGTISEWTFYKKFRNEQSMKKIVGGTSGHHAHSAHMPHGPKDHSVDSLFEPLENIDPLESLETTGFFSQGQQAGQPTACIKVLEELSVSSKFQCEGHCLRRRTQCTAYMFVESTCRLLSSLNCGENGEQIYQKADSMRLFRKLNGNCRGGLILNEYYDVQPAVCAGRCHRDERCKGFVYMSKDHKCVLKGTPCPAPILYSYDVSFWEHKSRLY